MRSRAPGKSTSAVEVCSISTHGFWLHVKGKEYFLPYEEYPWFRDAKVGDILRVELLHSSHLYWPALDVDLDVECLSSLGEHPLVYR